MSELGDLWLCDRSRHERGVGQCDFARYLEYHSGPYGYGIRPIAQSVYPTTGIYLHDAAKGIMDLFVEDWGADVEKHRNDVRAVIRKTVERYFRLIDARGLRGADAVENIRIAEEQACLIEGMAWVYFRKLLPWLMKNFTYGTTELEEETVLDCTCGLPFGVGEFADHVARNCNGIGWMSRADALMPRISDGEMIWHEYKTSADPHQDSWIAGWQNNVQFASGLVAAERRIGKEIQGYYVHGFAKGQRRAEKDKQTGKYSGPKKQSGILCYAFYKAGNPPLEKEDWKLKYTWEEFDTESGKIKSRRLGKGYVKKEIWKASFPAKPKDWTIPEYWVEWIGPEARDDLVITVGQYDRPSFLINEWLIECAANERRWQDKLWRLYEVRKEAVAEIGGTPSVVVVDAHPKVQYEFRVLFPRNWSGCLGYYGEDCEYCSICYKKPGWDDPVGSELFCHRRPHHDPEVNQMTARGIPVPELDDAVEHSPEN